MSGKAGSHVLAVPFVKDDRPALLVALAMATYADDRGRRVFPAVDTIAEQIHYHPAHVRKLIRRLRDPDDLNVVSMVRESDRYRPNEYRFVVHSEKCRLLFGDECVGELRQGEHLDAKSQGEHPDAKSDDQGEHLEARQGEHSYAHQGEHPGANRFFIESPENPQGELSSSKINRCSDGHEFVQMGGNRACKWCRTTQRSEKAKVDDLLEGIAS